MRDGIKENWRLARDLANVEKRATALIDRWIPEFGPVAPSLRNANGPAVYQEVWQTFEEEPTWSVSSVAVQKQYTAIRPLPTSARARMPSACQHLERLLAHHELLRKQKADIETELTTFYSTLDPQHLVRSLPGVGVTLASFLLALWPVIHTVRSRRH